MLEVIEVNISEARGQLNSYQLAERILKRIEQLGMLPPQTEEQIKEGMSLGFEGITRVIELRWESEDEQDS